MNRRGFFGLLAGAAAAIGFGSSAKAGPEAISVSEIPPMPTKGQYFLGCIDGQWIVVQAFDEAMCDAETGICDPETCLIETGTG